MDLMGQALPLTHARLEHLLSRLELGISAAHLHGSLCGYLCAGGSAAPGDWLADVLPEPDAWSHLAASDRQTLARLYQHALDDLNDPELRFLPLLPDDDEPLQSRADALSDWCAGFIGGIGLGGLSRASVLSGEAKEAMQDFETLARSRIELGDDPEADENAYGELLEFVRIGVVMLHHEFQQRHGEGLTGAEHHDHGARHH